MSTILNITDISTTQKYSTHVVRGYNETKNYIFVHITLSIIYNDTSSHNIHYYICNQTQTELSNHQLFYAHKCVETKIN